MVTFACKKERIQLFINSETDKTMMTATRREWSELYTFFTILAQGGLAAGTADGTEGTWMPVALVQRQEHDGTRS